MQVSGEPVFDSNGAFTGYRGVSKDITERKLAERSLDESAVLLRTIFERSTAGIVLWGADRACVAANAAYLRFTGYETDELVGRVRFGDFLDPSDREGNEYLRRLLAGEISAFDRDRIYVRKDGAQVWGHVSVSTVRDGGGRLQYIVSIVTDIAERMAAQETLRSSEERFRAIFERSDAGIALSDASGVYLSVNAAFAELVGYSAEELVGCMTWRSLMHSEESAQKDISGRLHASQRGHFRCDQRLLRKDGKSIWVRISMSLVRGEKGGSDYYISVISDVSEVHDAKERMASVNAELEERVAGRTKELRVMAEDLDAFSRSVSHDLRAPLGAIGGFAHLIRSAEGDRLTGDGRDLLGHIESNAGRALKLIDALFEFSRLGGKELLRGPLNVAYIVEDAVRELQADRQAEIAVGALPECEGDAILLRQVWINLIGNSLKYSRGRACPRIEIGYEPSAAAYYVRDNGAGFDMAHSGKLFMPFERLHSEQEFSGTGLGLALVQRIVRRHGGRVWAEGAPGKGATFQFSLSPAATGS